MGDSVNNREIIKASNDIAAYLVIRFAHENNISRENALERIMRTTIYAALLDEESQMYCEPKAAVYDMLIFELNNHPEEMINT